MNQRVPSSNAEGDPLRLGRYTLLAHLAEGGMGDIYVALLDGGLDRLFAIKRMKAQFSADDSLVRMFNEEARISVRLSHPNIVQTFELGASDGAHFIAMEYLEGQSLGRLLSRARAQQKELPLNLVLQIASDLLGGLEYIHTFESSDGRPAQMVHRDVTPHNVLITYDGQVKLIDFGIAKVTDSSQDATSIGTIKGKIGYMPLEQVRGDMLDGRADIYAAGVLLWEAIAGRRMWHGKSEVEILHGLTNEKRPRLREFAPNVSDELERIVERATAPNRAERYGTAREFQADLEQLIPNDTAAGNRDRIQLMSELFGKDRAEKRERIDSLVKASQQSLLSSTQARPGDVSSLPHLGSAAGAPAGEMASRSSTGPSARDGNAVGPHSQLPTASSGSTQRLRISAIASAIAVSGGILVIANYRPQEHAMPHASAPETSAAPGVELEHETPDASPSPSPTVKITIRVRPASARIHIDEVLIGTSPTVAEFFKGRRHSLRVEAPGFAPYRAETVAESDTQLEVSLLPLAGASPHVLPTGPKQAPLPTSSVQLPATSASSPASAENPPQKTKREIEHSLGANVA